MSNVRVYNRQIQRAQDLRKSAQYIESSFPRRIDELDRRIAFLQIERLRALEDLKGIPALKIRADSIEKAAMEGKKRLLEKAKTPSKSKPKKQRETLADILIRAMAEAKSQAKGDS